MYAKVDGKSRNNCSNSTLYVWTYMLLEWIYCKLRKKEEKFSEYY